MKVTHKTQSAPGTTVRREDWNEEHEIEGEAIFSEEVVADPGVQSVGTITVTLPGGLVVRLMVARGNS